MRREIATTAGRLDLVGRDIANARALPGAMRRIAPVAIAIAVVAALGVAALRIDLIRVRYGLASAVRQERALLEERREVLAEVRELREPSRLAKLAKQRGFVRPDRIRTLAPTTNEGTTTAPASLRP
jgi:hypothetical protein